MLATHEPLQLTAFRYFHRKFIEQGLSREDSFADAILMTCDEKYDEIAKDPVKLQAIAEWGALHDNKWFNRKRGKHEQKNKEI